MASQVLLEKALLIDQRSSRVDEKIVWRPWVLAAIALAIFASLILFLLSDGVLNRSHYWQWQQPIFIWLNMQLQLVLPASVWVNLTKAGDALVLLPLLAVVSIHQRQVWLALMATVPLAGLTSVLLKKLASVPRPGAVLDAEGWAVIGPLLTGHNSFPSGHSLCAFAAFSTFLVARYPQGKWQPVSLGLAIATLIAISRVAVGAHWPLDIVYGAALGCLSGLGGALLARHFAWPSPAGTKGRGIALLVLAMFAFALAREISSVARVEWVVWLALFACVYCCLHLLLEGLFSVKITVQRHHSV